MNNNQEIYDNELVKFEHIFSPIAQTIINFAQERNMYIEKYYQRQPVWTLFFIRKIGGVAQISINFSTFDRNFHIAILWSVDDFDKEIRYTKDWTKCKLFWKYQYNNNPDKLQTILLTALSGIKSLKRDDLNLIHNVKGIWKSHWYSKEEFEKQYLDRYPVLDI